MGKNCLVVGATGGIGRAAVNFLYKNGHKVRVLVRDKSKGEKYFKDFPGIEIIQGDASKPNDVLSALDGASHLFYCVNIPYPEWEERVVKLMKVSLDASAEKKTKFILPGNVYVYGHAQKNPVDELHPWNAHTKKGKIRIEMENMIKNSGTDWTVIRFPDFYGPWIINGFSEMLYLNALKNQKMRWIGEMDVPMEYIFIEDAGKALAVAGISDKSNGKDFNVPAAGTITNRQYLNMIKSQAGSNSKVQVIKSGLLFNTMSMFNRMIKEVKEMMYLKEESLLLDGSRFKDTFGFLPDTNYEDGIKQTLEWVKIHFSTRLASNTK